jgi:hypothetical protein
MIKQRSLMRRRPAPGKARRRLRKLAAWSFISALSFASIGGYVALSVTQNGPSPYWQFSGDVFLMQSISQPNVDKVQLTVQSEPFTRGAGPAINYAVWVCGPRPYSADLVLTEDAQITPINLDPGDPLFPSSVQRFSGSGPDYYISNSDGSVVDSGQVIRFNFPKTPPCQKGTTPAVRVVSGYLYGPLQQSWSGPWNLWHGPHAAQSWPQVGLPPSQISGSFTIPGIAGIWNVPASLNIEVTEDDPAPGWSINLSAPSTSAPDALSWSGTNEISPSAQLTNTASIAVLQDWIVISAIGFGIGGAMLASLLFEWIHPREAQEKPTDSRGLMNSSAPISRLGQANRTNRGLPTRLVVLGVAFVVGYARRRQRRHDS